MRLIFQLIIVLISAFFILNLLNRTEGYRNRDYVWFFYIFIVTAFSMFLVNILGRIGIGIRINVIGIIRFLLLMAGIFGEALSLMQLLMIFKRKGMLNQRIGGVILLNVAVIIVLLGLYYIR